MTRARLLHLSDLHLNADREHRYGVDADRALRLVLEACAHVEHLAAVVVTGDVADDGSVAAYERARDALLDFTTTRGAGLVFCVGNHDDRTAFAKVLGSGHFDSAGRDCGQPAGLPDRAVAVSTMSGIRIIGLDSLVPGKWYGSLGPEQLDWLDRALTVDRDARTVLAFHHPPIDVGVEIQQRVRLHDRDELAATVGPDRVDAILCGHFHQQIAGSVNGVRTWATPGVFTRIDHLTAAAGTERAYAGGGATLVDVGAPGGPVFATLTAADPNAGEIAYETTITEIEEYLAVYGIPR